MWWNNFLYFLWGSRCATKKLWSFSSVAKAMKWHNGEERAAFEGEKSMEKPVLRFIDLSLFFLHHLLASETFSFFIADMKNGIAQWAGEEEMHYRKINNRHVCNFLSFLIAVTHEILEKKRFELRAGRKIKTSLKSINNSWNVDLRFQCLQHFVSTLSAFSRVCFSSLRWTSWFFYVWNKKSIYCVVVLWGTQTNLIYVIEYGAMDY